MRYNNEKLERSRLMALGQHLDRVVVTDPSQHRAGILRPDVLVASDILQKGKARFNQIGHAEIAAGAILKRHDSSQSTYLALGTLNQMNCRRLRPI
jgi:hypothetical protein